MQTQLRPSLLRPRGVLLLWFGCASGCALAQSCRPQLLDGGVEHGHSWQHRIAPALDLKLEAVPAGWMVRVLPHGGRRPPHDAAELANPPYRSPSPILISTDFAFRAQDAIAWNPRTFRFFVTPAETARAETIYRATLRDPNHPAPAPVSIRCWPPHQRQR